MNQSPQAKITEETIAMVKIARNAARCPRFDLTIGYFVKPEKTAVFSGQIPLSNLFVL